MSQATSAPQMRFVISIINYRTAELTLQCIETVLSDMVNVSGRIVVVDNLSGDGSDDIIADWIAAQDPSVPVDLVRSTTNSGFSGGHNQGMSAHKADYYLVLNSDAVLKPGFLDAILDAADAAPALGLFAPRIDYDDGGQQVNCFRFPNPTNELIRSASTGFVTRRLIQHDMPLYPPPDLDRIEWASFACILLRGEMVDQIGLMDEGYFLYFEDTEYCLRAKRAGWNITYVPDACAVHFRGGSGPVKAMAAAKKRLPPYFYASRTRCLYQTHGHFGLLKANLAWHLGRGIAQMRRLTGKPVPPSNRAEWRDLWINFTTPLGDRRDGSKKS